jgi:hypothetical protein
LWLGLIWITPIVPACFDLQKVDPGPRVVADFDNFANDGGLRAAWNPFGPVKCGTFMGSDQHLGQDAGEAGTQADPDGSVNCTAEQPGDNDKFALEAAFQLNEPPGGSQQAGAAVVMRATPGINVDVTGFQQIWFSARFESASPFQLPTATELDVELGCSNNSGDPLASQPVDNIKLEVQSWPMFQFQLSLDAFKSRTARPQDCLRQVDSIHFTIHPNLASGSSTGGTLHLDNITLQY